MFIYHQQGQKSIADGLVINKNNTQSNKPPPSENMPTKRYQELLSTRLLKHPQWLHEVDFMSITPKLPPVFACMPSECILYARLYACVVLCAVCMGSQPVNKSTRYFRYEPQLCAVSQHDEQEEAQ